MHNVSFTNQKPGVLNAAKLTLPVAGTLNARDTVADLVTDALFQPMNANADATLNVDGDDVDAAAFTDGLLTAITSLAYDANYEEAVADVFSQGLVYYRSDTPARADEAFVTQAAVKHKLDYPTNVIIYTPQTDVIPQAKALLGGQCDFDMWFASLAYFARVETFAVSFGQASDFDEFKKWVAGQVAVIPNLPPNTVKLFSDFDSLDLGKLTESIIVRTDDDMSNASNDEYSFARMLHRFLIDYANVASSPSYGLMPFSMKRAILPHEIVFVNVDEHRRASTDEIVKEWDLIRASVAQPPKTIPLSKIRKLTTAMRAAQKYQNITSAQLQNLAQKNTTQSASIPLSSKRPTSVELSKKVARRLAKLSDVAHSHNPYKSQHASFARPNRRDPDNYNLKGTATSTRFHPDIHLYIDTSGSISEEDYEDMVKACIALARKLDVNLYFNSFSDSLSQCVLLRTRGRSMKQIYKAFQKVPKVSGGTDYAQIWRYINASRKRQKEFSLMVTDFEYYAPNTYIEHPKNLYYAPCSTINWDWLIAQTQTFLDTAKHIDPNLRSKLLF